MNIREANTNDIAAIQQIHLDAFGSQEGPAIARLVLDMLQDETTQPLLTLVADGADAGIVGCIMFSPVTVQGCEDANVYILAPLAVASRFQKQGVGKTLIGHGLRKLQAEGVGLVLVLGNPDYYGKYGFDRHHHILPPYPLLYPDAWMAQELRHGALSATRGMAVCANALSAPEYW